MTSSSTAQLQLPSSSWQICSPVTVWSTWGRRVSVFCLQLLLRLSLPSCTAHCCPRASVCPHRVCSSNGPFYRSKLRFRTLKPSSLSSNYKHFYQTCPSWPCSSTQCLMFLKFIFVLGQVLRLIADWFEFNEPSFWLIWCFIKLL